MKLLDASQISLEIQMKAINSILVGKCDQSHISTDFEQLAFGDLPKKIPIEFNVNNATHEKKIVLFNSLGWTRSHLTRVAVRSPFIKVIGPNGKYIPAQVCYIPYAIFLLISQDFFASEFVIFLHLKVSISINTKILLNTEIYARF